MNLFAMKILRIFTITTLLLTSIYSYPSRPLNERSKELTWQAWLLVDDQNQNKQNEPADALMRRRITPKSVFIAPTFTPEKLPACAEGYRSDAMGRCIQIIKLDQDAHLDFLLQKLNEKFGNFADDYDDATNQDSLTTQGPFQLNIPLANSEKIEEEQYDDNADIAIVVAPTNFIKVKRTESSSTNKIDNQETTTMETSTTEQQQETTSIVDEIESSSITEEDEYTSSTVPVTIETTTMFDDETTTDLTRALFFLNSNNNSNNSDNKTFDYSDVPLQDASDGIVIGNRMKIDADSSESATENVNVTTSQDIQKKPDGVKDPIIEPLQQQEPLPKQSYIRHTQSNLVLFPSSNFHTYQQLPLTNNNAQIKFNSNVEETEESTTKLTEKPNSQIEFESLFHDYITNRGSDLKSNERHIFKNRKLFHNNDDDNLNNNNNERLRHHGLALNHRNRDKNFWNIPSDWATSNVDGTNPNKPIVLKFTNTRTGSYISRKVNENLQQQNSDEGIYREVPPEDLSYIFGFKRMPRGNIR